MLATIYGLVAIWLNDGRSLADFAADTSVVDAATVPVRRSLPARLLASVEMLVAVLVFLLSVVVALSGLALIE